MNVPSGMPDDLPLDSVGSLMDTIQGICNESCLTRTEIVGALEGVKIALYMAWREELKREEC